MNRIAAARPSFLATLALVAALLSGCAGGSGSSGFDLSPSLEDGHIDLVLEGRQCRQLGDAVLCPSDAEPLPVPTATLPDPGGAEVRMETGLAGIDSLSCAEPPCRLELELSSSGLPSHALLQVAVRNPAIAGMWHVSSALPPPYEPNMVVEVSVPAGASELQMAVLVYLTAAPLAEGDVALLGESGASLIFVSSPVSILP